VDFGDELAGSWIFDYDREADVARSVSASVSDAVYRANLFGDSFQYLSAERIGPRPSFPKSDYWVREHQQLGVSGEYTSHFLSLFGERKVAQQVLAHPQEETLTLKAQVDAWMGEVSPGILVEVRGYPDIDFISLQYAFVVGKQVSNSYRSPNAGFGITFTLPVVVALLSASPGALILLENPEAHLHPQGQVKMAELMARAASCGIQVVVESHSDHILNGVRIAVRQGILHASQVVWLSDGARGLWHLFEECFTAYATGILDFYHAAQQLWKSAAAWLDGRTTQARRWFGWARHRLRHGQLDGVLADLAEALEVECLPDTTRDTLRTVAAYLERHREHMNYETYKALGLPLGSGMVESACKWLIQQRFKGVGMRWSEDGFNHLLHLRLAWVNGSFETLFQIQLQPSPNK
jgi:hypothetical protein